MIAQLKEDKLEVETRLADLPPPIFTNKMGERLEENLAVNQSDPQPTRENLETVAVKLVNRDRTQNKELSTEVPKLATPKKLILNEKETDIGVSDSQTNWNQSIDTLERMHNVTLEKCNEIPSQLQGKLHIVKEVITWFN